MDRRAIATARRHKLVTMHLEDEQAREAALTEELEEVVTELEGPALDAAVLAKLGPAEAEVARGVVQGGVTMDLGIEEDFFSDVDEEPYDPTADLEDEIVRLRDLIKESRARQAALQAYLDALAALPGA